MTPGEDVQRFTGGHAVGVDVAAIERDLAALWRQASEREAVTRACAWNLVFFTLEEGQFGRAKKLADAVVLKVPSRTLLLQARAPGRGPEVEAFVTAHCRLLPAGGKLLCSEEITLLARERGGEHLPSLVRSLVVPDIPTALCWLAPIPEEHQLARGLVSGMDRVVVDSAQPVLGGLSRLAQFGSLHKRAVLVDLNWLRLAPLRTALAQSFEPPGDPLLLGRLSRVVVEAHPQSLPAAHLLVGWLASRLLWGPPEPLSAREGGGWMFPRSGGRIRVEVKPSGECAGCGIQAVQLETDRGERMRVATVGASALELQGGTVATRRVASYWHQDEELLVAGLGSRGPDRLFPPALHRAVELGP